LRLPDDFDIIPHLSEKCKLFFMNLEKYSFEQIQSKKYSFRNKPYKFGIKSEET